MHLSPRHITGPSSVLCIAWVRHAAAQAGSLQCIHCILAYTVPFDVLYSLTTVRCLSSGFLNPLISLLGIGSGKPFSSAQSYSQPRQPLHRAESYRIPWNSVAVLTFGAAFSSLPTARVSPVAPRNLKKSRRCK